MKVLGFVMGKTKDFFDRNPTVNVKAYRRRWVILLIFVLYSAGNSFQWMEYAIIADIVQKYYSVNSLAVEMTSIIYMAVYPIIVVPVSFVIDVKGLRLAALIGGLGTALAAAIKVLSVGPGSFYVVLLGQAIGSTAQVFILCLPSKIAAVWFKPSECSRACSLAFFGTQMGFALGFVIPTLVVQNDDDVQVVASSLRRLCWGITILMIPVATAIIFYFPRVPPLPPSGTQAEERKKAPPTFNEFLNSFKKLLKKPGFIFQMTAYGINVGVSATIGTFLNQFILEYFSDAQQDAGRIGLLIVISGIIGTVLFGIYLDKFHTFKNTSLFIYYMAVVGVLAFMTALKIQKKVFVYIAGVFYGCFVNAYMAVGFELAVEITFPSDESTTTGLLNAMSQGLGVLIAFGSAKFNEYFGGFWTLAILASLLFLGALLTHRVPNENKRQEAFVKNTDKDDKLLRVESNL